MQTYRLEHESADLQGFGRVVGGVLKPFALNADGGHYRKATLVHRRSSRLQLSEIAWNNQVTLDAGRLERFHLVQIPLAGGFRDIGSGRSFNEGEGQFVESCSRVGLAIEPHCRLWILRIDEALLVSAGRQGLEILDFSTASGAGFLRVLQYYTAELDSSPTDDSAVVQGLENLVLHSLTALLIDTTKSERFPSQAVPYYVKRAETFIANNLRSKIGLRDVADFAGVSAGTLQSGFRRSRGMSPLAYRNAMRLDRAHDELVKNDIRSATVTEIATKWHFFELGKFARHYRLRFRENPLDTLKSAPIS
jgi:AraC-like DNA-binding protein